MPRYKMETNTNLMTVLNQQSGQALSATRPSTRCQSPNEQSAIRCLDLMISPAKSAGTRCRQTSKGCAENQLGRPATVTKSCYSALALFVALLRSSSSRHVLRMPSCWGPNLQRSIATTTEEHQSAMCGSIWLAIQSKGTRWRMQDKRMLAEDQHQASDHRWFLPSTLPSNRKQRPVPQNVDRAAGT